ncbi:MSMEG_4193 family putative phosphomutase [Nocardioides sp. BP30]|uniref:histidine phosphatase family protein n=1 Tax=Nocardioides sp. BP30 TaxID=3036374 RepID=UPI002468BC0D|nr:histidine phosphatase family protein [Nocardioides sp. BP30]WGL50820.1 MSMEG_4193 family putative phosphomutase [Nocardioides sp. BP30]
MATLILVRHGRTTANASGVLAGRTAGVRLDELGQRQAAKAGERLAPVKLAGVVTSPLERCRQTSRALLAARPEDAPAVPLVVEKAITECDYGAWQGRALKDLAKEPLWRTVQTQPSAVAFPEGETMLTMQTRAVAAVRRLDAAFTAEHGADAVWVAVSHGDIIKSILADALGMHLDLFQRLHVDPASISVIRYTDTRPFVLATNTHDGDLSWLNPPAKKRRTAKAAGGDAAVGGGAGPGEPAPARH